MKRLVSLAALVLAAAPALAQFEGQADFKLITNSGKDQSMMGTGKMFISRTAYRTEWEMQMPGTTRDKGGRPGMMKMTMFGKVSEPNKLYMINDQNKTYSVWDGSKSGNAKAPKETYTVKKLGKETVGGLSCQNAVLTSSKGDQIEACVSREISTSSDWITAMHRGDASSGSWLLALKDAGVEGFPIRWVMLDRDGKTARMTMELTRYQKKSLPASLFEVPAGYKQTDSAAITGLTPEQEKAMADAKARMNEALAKMSPEERKQYEEMMRKYAQPTPRP